MMAALSSSSTMVVISQHSLSRDRQRETASSDDATPR
jgi:hypothetical protein